MSLLAGKISCPDSAPQPETAREKEFKIGELVSGFGVAEVNPERTTCFMRERETVKLLIMNKLNSIKESFVIGTYNLLNPFHAVKWSASEGIDEAGEDNWDKGRCDSLISNINLANLDICAVQEINQKTGRDIQRVLPGLASMTLSRIRLHKSTEAQSAHGVAVLYNTKRFKLLDDKGIQTSQLHYRHASSVDLKERKTGSVYRVVSVHIEGYNPHEKDISKKRQEQMRGDHELLEYLKTIMADIDGLDGIFILGDFNEDAQEMRFRNAESRQGCLIDLGFQWSGVITPTETRSKRQIDWIFHLCNHSDRYTLEHTPISQDFRASDHALTAICYKRYGEN